HPAVGAVAGVDRDREHPARERLPVAGRDVGRRIADSAAASGARHHLTSYRVGRSEQGVGRIDASSCEVLAYARGLHDLATCGDEAEGFESLCDGAEVVERTLPSMPEAEVLADDDGVRCQLPELIDEHRLVGLRELAREALHDD